MALRHLKIAVSETVYWGVTAQAADRNTSAGGIFGELVEEALRARALGGDPAPIPSDPVTREMQIAAGIEGMSLDNFDEHLKAMGWVCWIEERIEAGDDA